MPRECVFVRSASLGPAQGADAYTTLDLHLADTNPGAGRFSGLVRARDGTSVDQFTAAVASVGKLVDERDFDSRGLELYAVGLKPDLIASVRPALMVLGVAGLFLVLMLMVNLATLLLTRAAQREQEFAVSRALGAHYLAVVRAMLLEGGLLGALGGGAAALVAVWGTRALVALAPATLPRRESIMVDWSVAALVIGTGVLLGLIAATAPAIWGARVSLASLLFSVELLGNQI
jgi:putative ABC transport system permease protein